VRILPGIRRDGISCNVVMATRCRCCGRVRTSNSNYSVTSSERISRPEWRGWSNKRTSVAHRLPRSAPRPTGLTCPDPDPRLSFVQPHPCRCRVISWVAKFYTIAPMWLNDGLTAQSVRSPICAFPMRHLSYHESKAKQDTKQFYNLHAMQLFVTCNPCLCLLTIPHIVFWFRR